MSEERIEDNPITWLNDLKRLEPTIESLRSKLESAEKFRIHYAKEALNLCSSAEQLQDVVKELWALPGLQDIITDHLITRGIDDATAFLEESPPKDDPQDFLNPRFYGNMNELRWLPYTQYLQTDHWQNLRKQMHEWADGRCQICNREGRLNVHHRTYKRRGQERLADLLLLCEDCHERFHTESEGLHD